MRAKLATCLGKFALKPAVRQKGDAASLRDFHKTRSRRTPKGVADGP